MIVILVAQRSDTHDGGRGVNRVVAGLAAHDEVARLRVGDGDAVVAGAGKDGRDFEAVRARARDGHRVPASATADQDAVGEGPGIRVVGALEESARSLVADLGRGETRDEIAADDDASVGVRVILVADDKHVPVTRLGVHE